MKLLKAFFVTLFITVTVGYSQNTPPWTETGPIQFPTNVSGQINGIGRTTQIKFHPSLNNIMYATTASGGVYKSINNGTNWLQLNSDSLPKTALASIAIDPLNDQVLYLGCGDPNYYSDDIGIYKSTDGGQSWFASHQGIGTLMAVEILINPANTNELIAATSNGIWKSYDAGANWVVKEAGGEFTDMLFQPLAGSQIVYACDHDDFYRSTNMEETWTIITSGLSLISAGGNGLRIAVTAANPQRVYLAAVTDEGTIFSSSDAGLTFTNTYHNIAVSLTGYDETGGGQGNYNFKITAHPANANTLYLVAHCVWRSLDGGVTWVRLTDWYANLHTDMHDIKVNPYNTTQVWNGNDGGIFFSTDNADTWTDKSDGLAATECYHAAVSQMQNDLISIGTQDNGELYYQTSGWFTNRGGDWGSRMQFDYNPANKVYYAENGERRNPVGGGTDDLVIPSIGTSNNMRFAFSSVNTNIALVGNADANGIVDIYRTNDLVSPAPVWTSIFTPSDNIRDIVFSPDNINVAYAVTRNTVMYRCDNAMAATPVFTTITTPASTVTAARIAPLSDSSGVVYVSCNAKVYRSANRGSTWTNVTYNLPAINIINVYWDQYSNDESIYVGTAKGVYYKNSSMTSWINYSLGLPTIADITDLMLYNDGSIASRLLISYYGRGVWQRGLYNQASAPPHSEFTSNVTEICPGESISFQDLSVGTVTAYQWSFPGGNPSTSNLQNPVIVYPGSGQFQASLTVSNANGSNTEVKNFYINVIDTVPVPVQQAFENSTLLIDGWRLSGTANFDWEEYNAGGFGNSATSIRADNYDNDAQGSFTDYTSGLIPTANTTGLNLSFDVAYAIWSSGYPDSLQVLVSNDCGATYTVLYTKFQAALATAPANSSSKFVPTASQWRTDNVNLGVYDNGDPILLMFRNIGHYGQPVYIDNINITGTVVTGIKANEPVDWNIYPNPANEVINIQVPTAVLNQKAGLLSITDISGQVLWQLNGTDLKQSNIAVPVKGFAAGVYFFNYRSGDQNFNYKLVKKN